MAVVAVGAEAPAAVVVAEEEEAALTAAVVMVAVVTAAVVMVAAVVVDEEPATVVIEPGLSVGIRFSKPTCSTCTPWRSAPMGGRWLLADVTERFAFGTCRSAGRAVRPCGATSIRSRIARPESTAWPSALTVRCWLPLRSIKPCGCGTWQRVIRLVAP